MGKWTSESQERYILQATTALSWAECFFLSSFQFLRSCKENPACAVSRAPLLQSPYRDRRLDMEEDFGSSSRSGIDPPAEQNTIDLPDDCWDVARPVAHAKQKIAESTKI